VKIRGNIVGKKNYFSERYILIREILKRNKEYYWAPSLLLQFT
jgi:hypothetical protein